MGCRGWGGGGGLPPYAETEGHVALGLEDLKDTGLMSRHVCFTLRRGSSAGWQQPLFSGESTTRG